MNKIKIKHIVYISVLAFAMSALITGCSNRQSSDNVIPNENETDAQSQVISVEPIQFETIAEERPDYTASDYVNLPDYTGLTVTDMNMTEITDSDVINEVRAACNAKSIDYDGLDYITDEQAAILSDQKYQTAQEYLDAVRNMLTVTQDFERKQTLFLDIFSRIYDEVEFTSLPEDVYAYDTSQDSIMQYALDKGYSYSQAEAMYAEDSESSDIELRDTLIQEKDLLLRIEMVLKCMSEDLGIDEPSDDAWNILMYRYGLFNREDLYDYFSEDDLAMELISVDVINAVMDQTDIEPIQYYTYSEWVETLDESENADTLSDDGTQENTETENDYDNAEQFEDVTGEESQTEGFSPSEDYQADETEESAENEIIEEEIIEDTGGQAEIYINDLLEGEDFANIESVN